MYKNYQVMGLKEAAQSLFLEDVIQWSCTPKSPNKRINWCILVLDREGMQIVSSSCKMHDLYHEGITLVEDLLKVREPVNLDAVYFLTPTKKSIAALVNDFPKDGVTKYKAAHIFFTKACPDSLFNTLSQSLPKRNIKSCKEINIAFIAFESQVFYLNCHDSFQSCYNPLRMNVRLPDLEELAIRISNVCHALNEYPSVRYMNNSNNTNNVELAKLVLEKLKIIKDDNPRMGDGYGKLRSQLIIIDRSFDITSLILHELTFQAMAYDNFPIRNDVFTFNENKVQKHVFFDQRDKLWDNIRHLHISTAVTTLSEKLKKCVNSLRASAAAADTANGSSVGAMSNAFKVIPIQKKMSEKFSIFMSVLKSCMDFYGEHLEEICIFEQDLVMGETASGERIKYDIKEKLTYFLTKENVSVQNKIRLIILYILSEDGVPEDIFNKLVQNAQLSSAQVQTIINLNMLGVTTITNGERQKRCKPERKQRIDENTFQVSRWTPLIKDLMENCVENKLDPEQFPSVGDKEPSVDIHKASSSRYTGQNVTWYKGKDSTKHQRSRVILFVLGGVTYSEMRCAYEISKSFKNWEIVIGSSHPLTPMDFIQELSKLDKP